MSNITIPESLQRLPLPPVSERFLRDLERLGMRDGKPLFRLVGGQRETHFRGGKQTIKHLLIKDSAPCYVTVAKTRYRRKNVKTGEYVMYQTADAAWSDKTRGLAVDIETATIEKREPVGRACWIVEVYVSPDEICAQTWEKERFDILEKNKVAQNIDLLGPFPREGMYIACFDVIDREGNAVSPSDRTIDECLRRIGAMEGDTRSVDEAINDTYEAMQKFEDKQLDLMNENFYQWAGIVANRERGGVVAKPIQSVKRADKETTL